MALLSTERKRFVLTKGPKCRNVKTRVLTKGSKCHNVEIRVLTKARKRKSYSTLRVQTKRSPKAPESSDGGAKGEAVELDGFPFNKRVAVLPV